MRNLLISLACVAVFATLTLGWLFDSVYEKYKGAEEQLTETELVEQSGHNLAAILDAAPDSAAIINSLPESNIYKVYIETLADAVMPSDLVQQLMRKEVVILETSNKQLFHFYLEGKDSILILESPKLRKTDTHTFEQYFLTLLFYVLLIALFLLWAYPLLKQLSSLRNAAKSLGDGKLNEQINTKSTSYIRDIETEFNRMATRISSLVSDVKLLSSAVSHDLRTPLARIRFGLDTLEEVEDDQHRDRLMKRLGEDVDEMTALVEALLGFSRLDQHSLELKKVNVNLAELITEASDKFNANSTCVELILPQENIFTCADRNYLKMALNNLIQNGINYGNGKALVELKFDTNQAFVCVHDDGKGVPPELHESILKPFIRGSESDKLYKGHGLGLAIVKRVLDWHNGRLRISDSKKLNGAEFEICLPRE